MEFRAQLACIAGGDCLLQIAVKTVEKCDIGLEVDAENTEHV